jgi:hypothetical protein
MTEQITGEAAAASQVHSNKTFSVLTVAQICHEANRALCEATGDHSQQPWQFAEDWQRESAINGVQFALNNPDAPDSAQHDAWSAEKIEQGWTYGTVKDADAKTHPCLIPFDELPPEQRAKDTLFRGIVKALTSYL